MIFLIDSDDFVEEDYVEYFTVDKDIDTMLYDDEGNELYEYSLIHGYAEGVNAYGVFLGGDQPLIVSKNSDGNGKKIAVVKESYGNAMIPFLAASYEKVVVIDQRYLQKGLYQVIEQFGVNELLFINNILAAHTPVRIQEIVDLPNRSYQPQPQVQPEQQQEDTQQQN